jgi:hypothetical protein
VSLEKKSESQWHEILEAILSEKLNLVSMLILINYFAQVILTTAILFQSKEEFYRCHYLPQALLERKFEVRPRTNDGWLSCVIFKQSLTFSDRLERLSLGRCKSLQVIF